MSDFDRAYNRLLKTEGGYANDPNDRGGETYKGISRRYNPGWTGWPIIDSAKGAPNFPASLDAVDALQDSVRRFYKGRYWDAMLCNEIEDQDIAEELLDTGVNMNTSRAVSFLQTALNVANRNGSLYGDLVVDGALGARTLSALRLALRGGDKILLLKVMNVLQGAHYIDFMTQSPDQETYARGWFARVTIGKEGPCST